MSKEKQPKFTVKFIYNNESIELAKVSFSSVPLLMSTDDRIGAIRGWLNGSGRFISIGNELFNLETVNHISILEEAEEGAGHDFNTPRH